MFRLLMCCFFGFGSARGEPTRPNIVFILADDLGYGDLASYGHPRIKTPNLDRLADEGTRFTQFYVSHSVCSPTRASAITGQYPSRWNIYAHLAWLSHNAMRGMPDWLDAEAPSVPRAMQQAGYRTALFGKWHLGGGSGRNFGGRAINSIDAPPVASYGFDECRVVAGNGPTWRGAELRDQAHDLYPYADDYFVTWSSRMIVDASIAFIEEHQRSYRERPFMLNVWFHDPHVPLTPTREMRAAYSDITDSGAQAYYAVVSHMDQQVGRLMARLDQLGLAANTLVVFTSDNGAPAREGSIASGKIGSGESLATDTAGSNGALRGWKWHLHEGGIRVPLIVRWPGRVPAGRLDTSSVLNICDFAPIYSELAGAVMPSGYKSDGADTTGALFGRPVARDHPIFWHNPTANRRGSPLAIREGDWKLLTEIDGTEAELYNLTRDAAESNNLARDNADVAASLRKKLLDWYRTLPAPLERVVIP